MTSNNHVNQFWHVQGSLQWLSSKFSKGKVFGLLITFYSKFNVRSFSSCLPVTLLTALKLYHHSILWKFYRILKKNFIAMSGSFPILFSSDKTYYDQEEDQPSKHSYRRRKKMILPCFFFGFQFLLQPFFVGCGSCSRLFSSQMQAAKFYIFFFSLYHLNDVVYLLRQPWQSSITCLCLCLFSSLAGWRFLIPFQRFFCGEFS